MFRGQGGKPFFQEAAVEIGVVSDDEDYPAQQIVDRAIVNALTRHHRIGNAGDLRDLGWDRNARIFAPVPGAENLVDPPALPVVLEGADA
jgi:hypothetical protein